MPIDPSQPEQVAQALSAYFAARDGFGGVRFAEPPAPLGRGFDTFIYGFRLEGTGLDPVWARPLVLRLYPGVDRAANAVREAAIQRFVASRGYPALDPRAIEGADNVAGLPFMIMERVAGKTMLERITANPFAVPRLLAAMADLHVELHRMPLDGCPLTADRPLAERQLDNLRARIDRLGVRDLDEGLAWLERNSDAVADEELSLCHNDFHPMNILISDDGGRMTVIDWTDAALGDRHHDVARTVTLFWFAQIAARGTLERLVLRAARGFMASRYLNRYRAQLPVDRSRLAYWQAAHAFNGWLQLRELSATPPGDLHTKTESAQRIAPSLVDEVRDYFWHRTRAASIRG